ncbi:hypothetical protein ACWGII_17130 [Streptomyces sp. NPDC054855]
MPQVSSDISSPSPPPPCPVPHFSPVRVRGGRRRLRRLLRHRRRAMAAGLAVTAAALVAAGPRDVERARPPGHPAAAAAPSRESERASEREFRAAAMVTAPVRIADAETVRLLHRGDRVDVVASDGSTSRVVAAGARVTEVPEPQADAAESAAEPGALLVLSVPRATAARLAGAGAGMRLAVTLC